MTLKFEWFTPSALTRLLVISYFIAVSLGMIHGTRILDFMLPVLPDEIATSLMRGVVLTLSVLILTGLARRTAALVLSLVVFFSSYAALYSGGDISAFWRDLALVGALLMTANFKDVERSHIQWSTQSAKDRASPPRVPPKEEPVLPRDDQPFRDDFDIVRSG